MQEGSSDDPCSGVYHGESAGSELEVQAITKYIESHAPIVASIDFHSYYQQILFPPGKEDLYTCSILQWCMLCNMQTSITQYSSHFSFREEGFMGSLVPPNLL